MSSGKLTTSRYLIVPVAYEVTVTSITCRLQTIPTWNKHKIVVNIISFGNIVTKTRTKSVCITAVRQQGCFLAGTCLNTRLSTNMLQLDICRSTCTHALWCVVSPVFQTKWRQTHNQIWNHRVMFLRHFPFLRFVTVYFHDEAFI